MIDLEELTLYVNLPRGPQSNFADYLNNEILIGMAMLHSFTFHLTSEHLMDDYDFQIPESSSVQILTNVKYCEQVACVIDYTATTQIYRLFSLPFKFWFLRELTYFTSDGTFHFVTHLRLEHCKHYSYQFFCELNQNFPLLKNLSLKNVYFPCGEPSGKAHDTDWLSVIKYAHLTSLDIGNTNFFYVDDFLNERKTSLPHLTRLKINYFDLAYVTQNFRRAETKRNCNQIKWLEIERPFVYSKDVYEYFPSL